MAANIKGPAIFLAQFAGDAAPFNSWGSITKWAAPLGYKGVQIPAWDARLFDLKKAAENPDKDAQFPGIGDGVAGMAFIEACVKSSAKNGRWTKV